MSNYAAIAKTLDQALEAFGAQRYQLDQLVEPVNAYRLALIPIFRRATYCERYLDKGLFGEADHLASLTPKLAPALESLRIERRDTLTVVFQQLGYDDLPNLPHHLSDRLAAAAETVRAADGPLRANRQAALTASGIGELVTTTAKLAELFGGRDTWLRLLTQLDDEFIPLAERRFEEAARLNSEDRLAAISTELEGVPRPHSRARTKLLQQVLDALQKRGREQFEKAIGKLVQAALIACEQRDVNTVQQALAAIKAESSAEQFAVPKQLQQQIQRILAWSIQEARSQSLSQRQERARSLFEQPIRLPWWKRWRGKQ